MYDSRQACRTTSGPRRGQRTSRASAPLTVSEISTPSAYEDEDMTEEQDQREATEISLARAGRRVLLRLGSLLTLWLNMDTVTYSRVFE